MKKSIALILAITLISVLQLHSEDEKDFQVPFSAGFYAGLNFNMHSPSFSFPPQGIFNFDTVAFDNNTTSVGLNLGGIINIPINSTFVFSGRIGYNGMGAKLENGVDNTPIMINDTSITPGDMDASINYLEISPIMQFHNLLPLKRLYFLAGLEFGIPISTEYKYAETKAIDNTVITVNDESKIPEKNLRAAIALGVGYYFSLGESTFLAPELSFRIPLNQVSSSSDFDSWNVPQLRLGLSLTFDLEGEKGPEPDPSFLNVGFTDVRKYDKEGNTSPIEKITVEEVQYRELFPLIPYVFCSENDQYPSGKSQLMAAEAEAGEFSLNMLEADATDINMHTLDIIGSRMALDKNSTITITGTIDENNEVDDDELALKRAEFAKNYLVINYGISQDRIKIMTTGWPERASAKNDPDGMEENRRIEFSSPGSNVLAPIIIEKDKQALADPDMVEFIPFAESKDTITKWEFEIVQADRSIKKISGLGNPEAIKWNIMPNQLAAGELPVEYIFSAENDKGLEESATGSIPVDFYSISRKRVEDRPDRTISKFSLILFDFDKADISEQDKKIIEENVLPEVKFNSTIQIYGYSDRIGEEDYNRKLSQKRADAVKTILSRKVKTAKFEVYGVGENHMVFDNDNPVGRQLSRTVQIYVITPKD